MVLEDSEYIKDMLKMGLIQSPCLELGVGYEGLNNKQLIVTSGMSYIGTDMVTGSNVDFVVNFEDPSDKFIENYKNHFGTVLILNVLEHTFDPIRVLNNVFSIIKHNGTCVIITPTVWPLHSYPYDYWRINPDFYESYSKINNYSIIKESFKYIGKHSVDRNLSIDGKYTLPSPTNTKIKYLFSKVIHKLFNTFGRSMIFPSHVATGVVIKKDVLSINKINNMPS